MKNSVYVFTIEFLDENAHSEYKTIVGLYQNVEDAAMEANKKLQEQKSFWENSYEYKLGKGKVALIWPAHCSKIYQIKEMEVK